MSALLVRGVTVIRNAPSAAADTLAVIELVRSFGLVVRIEGSDIILTNTGLTSCNGASGRHRSTRYSVLLLPILLRLNGRVQLPPPGGCGLGHRPLTVHFAGLSAFGAECNSDDNLISASLVRQGQDSFTLSYPSVTATECLIVFSVLGSRVRTLRNCALEPEIEDLSRFLNSCGAQISGAGTADITIAGVESLRGSERTLIPDRIEIGTFAFLSAIMRKRLELTPVVDAHVDALFAIMKRLGVVYEYNPLRRCLIIHGDRSSISPIQAIASPFPAFPTDLQPLLGATCLMAAGLSRVRDTVFPNRFTHLGELARLGAVVRQEADTALIWGPATHMKGNDIVCHDIRGGAACVLAALLSQGPSVIRDDFQIQRGYHRFFDKLRHIGIDTRDISANVD